ncbi:MAG TPA: hypothetical protein VMW56_15550 [Candidatus Margulisiibacteriota bacterium]|nr:hypothetical protein [Candidatus Margulisiibacteriota bacterium]
MTPGPNRSLPSNDCEPSQLSSDASKSEFVPATGTGETDPQGLKPQETAMWAAKQRLARLAVKILLNRKKGG